MPIAPSGFSQRVEAPAMYSPEPDRTAAEYALMVARRRADACSPGGPSWDAAMGLVDDLERAVRQFDQRVEPTPIRDRAGASPSR
jgi:hypothetical protein